MISFADASFGVPLTMAIACLFISLIVARTEMMSVPPPHLAGIRPAPADQRGLTDFAFLRAWLWRSLQFWLGMLMVTMPLLILALYFHRGG